MRLNPETPQGCKAKAIAHEGGKDTATVTLLCGERIVQIATGISNLEIGVARGKPIHPVAAYRAERIATEALEGFCVNCRNKCEDEERGGTVITFPPAAE